MHEKYSFPECNRGGMFRIHEGCPVVPVFSGRLRVVFSGGGCLACSGGGFPPDGADGAAFTAACFLLSCISLGSL